VTLAGLLDLFPLEDEDRVIEELLGLELDLETLVVLLERVLLDALLLYPLLDETFAGEFFREVLYPGPDFTLLVLLLSYDFLVSVLVFRRVYRGPFSDDTVVLDRLRLS
jgi:hypothetical protein